MNKSGVVKAPARARARVCITGSGARPTIAGTVLLTRPGSRAVRLRSRGRILSLLSIFSGARVLLVTASRWFRGEHPFAPRGILIRGDRFLNPPRCMCGYVARIFFALYGLMLILIVAATFLRGIIFYRAGGLLDTVGFMRIASLFLWVFGVVGQLRQFDNVANNGR